MSTTSTCDNPLCTCSPCTCAACGCGVARLGDLERRVMDILWASSGSEMTVRDVADRLPASAYTTVATILDRLTRKGLVSRRKERNAIRFTAHGTAAAHAAMLMYEVLRTAEDADAVLARFVERASPAEARTLQRALDSLEHQSGGPDQAGN